LRDFWGILREFFEVFLGGFESFCLRDICGIFGEKRKA